VTEFSACVPDYLRKTTRVAGAQGNFDCGLARKGSDWAARAAHNRFEIITLAAIPTNCAITKAMTLAGAIRAKVSESAGDRNGWIGERRGGREPIRRRYVKTDGIRHSGRRAGDASEDRQ